MATAAVRATNMQLEADMEFLPVAFEIAIDKQLCAALDRAEVELKERAQENADGCWGYFYAHDQESLPKTHQAKVALTNTVQVEHPSFQFSFLRYALEPQQPRLPGTLHVDSNSHSGIGAGSVPIRVWRMLINVSSQWERKVAYSLQRPDTSAGTVQEGLFTSDQYDPEQICYQILPKRQGTFAHGLIFCASEVLHGGKDGKLGHYLAAFGCDEIV